MSAKAEKEYYKPIKAKLEDLLRARVDNFHLEITANGFSRELKDEVKEDIVWHFLQERKARPDITGFVKGEYTLDFIVVEVKQSKMELDDIYQLRKYRDLFDAKFAFLASLQPIPGEIKRLHKVRYWLLASPSHLQAVVLAHFDEDSTNFVEWYPENPFEKDLYWR